MVDIEQTTIDVARRHVRMREARGDPHRTTSDIIAAMAAGSGAELVAGVHKAHEILAARLAGSARVRS